MDGALERFLDTMRFPLDDPQQTLIAVLVTVVAGLLVAVVLIAIASPGNPRRPEGDETESESSDTPTE